MMFCPGKLATWKEETAKNRGGRLAARANWANWANKEGGRKYDGEEGKSWNIEGGG